MGVYMLSHSIKNGMAKDLPALLCLIRFTPNSPPKQPEGKKTIVFWGDLSLRGEVFLFRLLAK